jgi:hypothetical protein
LREVGMTSGCWVGYCLIASMVAAEHESGGWRSGVWSGRRCRRGKGRLSRAVQAALAIGPGVARVPFGRSVSLAWGADGGKMDTKGAPPGPGSAPLCGGGRVTKVAACRERAGGASDGALRCPRSPARGQRSLRTRRRSRRKGTCCRRRASPPQTAWNRYTWDSSWAEQSASTLPPPWLHNKKAATSNAGGPSCRRRG